MKKLLYITLFAIVVMTTSCGEDFLEREDLYTTSSGTYYATPDEIASGLAAAYNQLAADGGINNITFISNLLSDDAFSGGGTDDIKFHDTDAFDNTQDSHYEGVWSMLYAGILRANIILENIDNVTYDSENEKSQVKGETLFLRAYFHFRLTQLFGQITLKSSSAAGTDVQASYDDIYNLIASDLKTAIEIMPATSIVDISKSERGHVTKWAAEALMARVFLYYTGIHGQAEIKLSDGSTITKSMTIAWIEDCIDNSGHYLYDDFRELWPICSAASDTVNGDLRYPWAIDNNLEWVGDANDESVLMVKYSSVYGDWAESNSYVNNLCLFQGVRGQVEVDTYPYGKGWGGCTSNPQLYAAYSDKDIRRDATLLNLDNTEEGIINKNYLYGNDNNVNETHFYNKKYTPVSYNNVSGKGISGMYYALWGGQSNYMLNQQQDEVLIRFSDVLLMGAELKEDVSLLNQVRTRAGLEPLAAYSLKDLQTERKLELAYEGIRFWDVLRWGIAEQEFSKVANVPVYNQGVEGTYTMTYRSETKGLLPIPQSQIAISNGVLVQNEGW